MQLPKKKALTKWEKFARAKGIAPKKKSKKVYSEKDDEFRNRWGYKGLNDPREEWLTEIKDNEGELRLMSCRCASSVLMVKFYFKIRQKISSRSLKMPRKEECARTSSISSRMKNLIPGRLIKRSNWSA